MISVEKTTILRHQGSINGPIIAELLDDLDFKCINYDIPDPKRKKVFNIAVEMFQNLYHYTRDFSIEGYTDDVIRQIFLSLELDDQFCTITTSNSIKNQDINQLSIKIDQVNNLDDQGLRALYKITLNNEEFSDKGGAGLGFIDMKKRSGLPLEYEFERLDEKISRYTLKVKVKL